MPSLSHQWTIKSKRFDKELVTGCRLAAERQGMAMGDWCVNLTVSEIMLLMTLMPRLWRTADSKGSGVDGEPRRS